MELELRLILLAIGLAIIGLIYVWGMRKNIKESLERRKRLKKQRSSETLLDAMPAMGGQSKSGGGDEINILDEFEVRVIDRTAEYRTQMEHRDALGGGAVARSVPKKPVEPIIDAVRNEAPEAPVPAELRPAESRQDDVAAEPSRWDEMDYRVVESDPDEADGQAGEAKDSGSEQSTMTVLLTVIAPSGQGFSGTAIRKVAKELALPLGEQGVLECNTDAEAGKRPKTVFSVAHLREPGTFHADTFETLTTPGLLLFLSLPGPLSATEAVRMMFGVAGQLAEKLGGTVCDEKRRRFTRDGYVELHRRASQFEQQTMSEA